MALRQFLSLALAVRWRQGALADSAQTVRLKLSLRRQGT